MADVEEDHAVILDLMAEAAPLLQLRPLPMPVNYRNGWVLGYRHQREWSAAKFTNENFRIASGEIKLRCARFFQLEGDHTGILDRSFAGGTADGEPAGKYEVAEVFNRVIPYEIQVREQFFSRFEPADDRELKGTPVDVVEAEHAYF
jgi:hypothetical protein